MAQIWPRFSGRPSLGTFVNTPTNFGEEDDRSHQADFGAEKGSGGRIWSLYTIRIGFGPVPNSLLGALDRPEWASPPEWAPSPPAPVQCWGPWARGTPPHSLYYYNPQTGRACPGCFSACRRRFSTGIEIPVGIGSGGGGKHGKRCFGGRSGWCSPFFLKPCPGHGVRKPSKTVQNRENHGFFGVSSDLATSGE